MFWKSNKTKPRPNSMAEKTKKKKVKDKIFKLSKIKPIKRVTAYKVIQSSSAVSNKWRLVLMFTITLKSKRKKKMKSKFKSPKNIKNFLTKPLKIN